MGNDLEKQYNLKTKPLKLVGSYNFLKYADDPLDSTKSLIILKPPHRVSTINNSTLILPIINIKQFSSCIVAVCPKCLPLILHRPTSEIQLKIIIYKMIKNGSELGRYFFCRGRLMLWGQQKRGFSSMSPQQVQNTKACQKSQLFTSGLTIVNYLHYIYQKVKKQQKTKIKSLNSSLQVSFPLLFQPKDKKQYLSIIPYFYKKLTSCYFWQSISQSLQKLIESMLQIDKSLRATREDILNNCQFTNQLQLILYTTLADQIQTMSISSAMLFMQTLQFFIKDQKFIDKCLMENYFIPVMISILNTKPFLVLSCLIEVPNPPSKQIYLAFKKCDPKSVYMMKLTLLKKQRLYQILNEDQYDGTISRMTFCIFECENLWSQLLRALPFIMRTIHESNYRKEIQSCLVQKIIMGLHSDRQILILALKAAIQILKQKLLSSVTKYYQILMNPIKYELQTNLHILYLYKLMIEQIQPKQLLSIMMPKLQPYLSSSFISDQVFFSAQSSLKRILKRLQENRNITEIIKLQYDAEYFKIIPKQNHKQINQFKQKQLLKKILNDNNPNLNQLKQFLGYMQQPKDKDLMNQ